jgi:membrane protein required for colicin V production
MFSNWLDILLFVILALSLTWGVIKGFVRQVVGIAAVVAGLILAGMHYPILSRLLNQANLEEPWADLAAFLLIFIAVLIVGALASFLLSKMMRGPLRFINHVLGGALGVIKGVLICGVLVIALLVFPVDKPTMMRSSLAPYCYWLTKGMIELIPQELKDKFRATYQEIIEGKRDHGQKI